MFYRHFRGTRIENYSPTQHLVVIFKVTSDKNRLRSLGNCTKGEEVQSLRDLLSSYIELFEKLELLKTLLKKLALKIFLKN